MTKYMRKYGLGSHTLKINGKRHSIRPGDFIECRAEDLGSFVEDYELVPVHIVEKHINQPGFVVAAPDGTKYPGKGCLTLKEADKLAEKMNAEMDGTPLKRETERYEGFLRRRSPWLSQGNQSNNTLVSLTIIDKSYHGLKQALQHHQSEKFNTDGQATTPMAIAKLNLQTAWKQWKYQVDIDVLKRKKLDSPEDRHLEAIAEAQAGMNVLEAEIAEIKRLIELKEVEQKKVSEVDEKRRKFIGHLQLMGGKIAKCDGRIVVYKAGKPYFANDGMSIEEYMALCKEHKTKKHQRNAKEQHPATPRQRSTGA